MNGDFYKVVQGGKNCPFLEKAKSCPNDVDDLPPCHGRGNLLLLPPLVVAGQVAPRGAPVAADLEPGRREGSFASTGARRAAQLPGR